MESRFSLGAWIGGFCVAFVVGSFANVLMIMFGLRINETVAATILGLIPGAVIIAFFRRSKDSFGKGMLVGAIVVAILGGACAEIFTATQVKS